MIRDRLVAMKIWRLTYKWNFIDRQGRKNIAPPTEPSDGQKQIEYEKQLFV